MTNKARLLELMELNGELIMSLPPFRYEVGKEGRKITFLSQPDPDEKPTPRWERPKDEFCPRCGSDILRFIRLENGNEVIVRENCTSCEWVI